MSNICTFKKNSTTTAVGLFIDGKIVELNPALRQLELSFQADSVMELLAAGAAGRAAVKAVENIAELPPELLLDAAAVTLAPPVPRPGKILCLAGNYLNHLAEHHGVAPAQMKRPDDIHVFTKCWNAVKGPYDDIFVSKSIQKLDYELELGFVIGKNGRYIPEERATEHIAGYFVANDVSARDFMPAVAGGRIHWYAMKNQDGFMPFGPYLLLKDSIGDISELSMELRVNGEVRQRVNPQDMLFKPEEIVARISRWSTLEPGDIILTGTPAGDSWSRGCFLKDGDVVEATMEKVGTLRNRIVFENAVYRCK